MIETPVTRSRPKGPSRRSSRGSSNSSSRSASRHRHEILTLDLTLNNKLPHELLTLEILSFAEKLCIYKWSEFVEKHQDTKSVLLEKVTVKRISGALTNAIYKISCRGLSPLLLRVYGPHVSKVVNRQYELQILERLSGQNIGAKLLGCFTNGRFEQWLEDTEPLTALQMKQPVISSTIARRMRMLHERVLLTPDEARAGSAVWRSIDKWLVLVADFLPHSAIDDTAIFGAPFAEFFEAVEKYRRWLLARSKSALVFCHNDTQYGNLLLKHPTLLLREGAASSAALSAARADKIAPSGASDEDEKLIVIDFEYAGPNPAAYDIADHFCEWMADYHTVDSYFLDASKFPTKQQQMAFLKSYLGSSESPDSLYQECVDWRPAVNISWCLWGVIQSKEYEAGEEVWVDETEEKEGGDTDSFEYLKYSLNKAQIVWGDLMALGIIDKVEGLETKELPV